MAERLKREQPTSSIASALNLDAVRAATTRAPPATGVMAVEPQRTSAAHATPFTPAPGSLRASRVALSTVQEPRLIPAPDPTGERASILRQFQLTPTTDAILKQLIAAYSGAIGFELHATEFLRGVLIGMADTVELHAREARGIGPRKRPKNEASQFHKRDELERAIGRAFVVAMRGAPIPE